MLKRIKFGPLSLSIFTIATLGVAGYLYYSSHQAELLVKTTDARIAAGDLLSQFDRSESLSEREYLNKTLSVNGIVNCIRKNEAGGYTLTLGDRRDKMAIRDKTSTLTCDLDPFYNRHPVRLKPGDSCTIRGTCAGHFMNIVLLQCIIEK